MFFPDPGTALQHPNGLLAAGGDLSVERLLLAYRMGIFPWYSKGEPILWWSPDPRMVLFPGKFHVSRSLEKNRRRFGYHVTFNTGFARVIEACSQPRQQQPGTWITDEMKAAYIRLHELGHAHSIECWRGNKLVGGVYGVVLGRCFFGESMFSIETDASKTALAALDVHLQQKNFKILDCQVHSDHMASLGAVEIPRSEFLSILEDCAGLPDAF